jgi:hypothetical protein
MLRGYKLRVSFWGERLDDCDLFLVEFGFEVLRRNRSIHVESPCRTLRVDEIQFVSGSHEGC